jgi:hypothetical protein
MPSRDPNDASYRRLRYCRYDDWLLGFTGPKQEAEQIMVEVGRFLHEQLKLELSPTKTLITHGRTQAARFLGYEVVVLHADDKHDHRGHRSINAAVGLKVPLDVIHAKCKPYQHHGRPVRRTERIVDTDTLSFSDATINLGLSVVDRRRLSNRDTSLGLPRLC